MREVHMGMNIGMETELVEFKKAGAGLYGSIK